jgi:hypothetical protein
LHVNNSNPVAVPPSEEAPENFYPDRYKKNKLIGMPSRSLLQSYPISRLNTLQDVLQVRNTWSLPLAMHDTLALANGNRAS